MGFLGRLRRDIGGNVLFITAAMMVPFLAFSGCAVDAARLYFVKMRLQQACDAGVLAGRKSMTSTTVLDDTASAQATAFFNNNFRDGLFGASSVSFTPTRTASGQVAGTAQATVPMAVMSMFGVASQQLSANCEARFDVADTDVIFVLDTTGSMACLPSDSDTTCSNYVGSAGTTTYTRPADGATSGNASVAGYPGSTAYYVPEKTNSRIAALRAAVLSFYDTLTAASDPSTHIRYGFVTYTSTVNAGKAIMSISPAYMVGGTGSVATQWWYQSRKPSGSNWQYQRWQFDVTGLVSGGTVVDPTKSGTVNTRWTGCIEEADTSPGEDSFTQSSLPNDLNPDLVPSATDVTKQWKPMWPEVVYARNNFSSTNNVTNNSNYTNLGATSQLQTGYVTCGKPVSRLKVMSRTDISAYVNAADFRPIGGTYHDTGMIWGTRLVSPNGIFSGDTAAWPSRAAPNRVIVFLTDGDMAPNQQIYGLYGLEYYDRRVSNGDFPNLTNYHNARFLAECAAAKARNVSVWTVSISSSATTEMQQCASTSTQSLATTDGTGLSNAFTAIAKQVAMLRLSR